MHVDIIDDIETLRRLESNWDAIYAADPDAQFFLSFTWMSGWLKELAFPWIVLAVKEAVDSNEYVGFFPLQLRTVLRQQTFFNDLRTAASYPAGYTGFLADPRYERAAIAAFAAELHRLSWRCLFMESIAASPARLDLFFREFSSTEFALNRLSRRDHAADIDHSTYVYVDLPQSWEEYLQTKMTSSTRKHARRALREIDGPSEFRVTYPTTETIDRDLAILLDLWKTQWSAALEQRYGVHMPAAMANDFRYMLGWCFRHSALFMPVLWKEERPVAARAMLTDTKNRSLIGMIAARDMMIGRPSPGFSLHVHSIRWAIRNGFRRYDLQTGDFSYKYDFGGTDHRVETWQLSTKSGRNLHNWLERRSLPDLMSQVRQFYSAGKLDVAENGCRQALEIDPENQEALRILSTIRTAHQWTEKSMRFQGAVELHRAREFAKAESAYVALLRDDRSYFPSAYMLGVLYLERRQFSAADALFRHAAELQPTVARLQNNRAYALRGLGRFEEALACCEKAISLNPEFADAFNNAGVVLRQLGREEEALRCFSRALSLKPKYSNANLDRDVSHKETHLSNRA